MQRVPHAFELSPDIAKWWTEEHDRDVHAYFPIEWDFGPTDHSDGIKGPPVKNPTTIYFGVPLGVYESCDDLVYWKTTLTEMVDQFIEGGQPTTEDPEQRLIAEKLRDGFLACAKKIQDALDE